MELTRRDALKGLVALALGAAGCNGKRIECYRIEGTYENYDVILMQDNFGRKIKVIGKDSAEVYGRDRDFNGRFDEIILFDVPKDHALESYASIGKLEEIFDYVKRVGKED